MLLNKPVVNKFQNLNMMLPWEGYVLSEIFVIVRWFLQTLQAHKLNMIRREKLARHPRTTWRIWACDVRPTLRMIPTIVIMEYSKYILVMLTKIITDIYTSGISTILTSPYFNHQLCHLSLVCHSIYIVFPIKHGTYKIKKLGKKSENRISVSQSTPSIHCLAHTTPHGSIKTMPTFWKIVVIDSLLEIEGTKISRLSTRGKYSTCALPLSGTTTIKQDGGIWDSECGYEHRKSWRSASGSCWWTNLSTFRRNTVSIKRFELLSRFQPVPRKLIAPWNQCHHSLLKPWRITCAIWRLSVSVFKSELFGEECSTLSKLIWTQEMRATLAACREPSGKLWQLC